MELRRRLSSGIAYSVNYTWGQDYVGNRYSFRTPRVSVTQTGTDGQVTHAFKGNWVFELPFGRGRHFAANLNPVADRIIGGWEFDGVGRIQTGEMLDFGNVRVIGMTKEEFQKSIDLRFAPNGQVYILPQDIVDNTIKAFNTSATDPTGYASGAVPTGRYLAPQNSVDCIETANGTAAPSATNLNGGYGACGVNSLVITGPRLITFDLSAVKRITVIGRTNIEFRAEMLNAFNRPYFTPRNVIGTTDNSYRLTGTQNNPRVVQLVFRVNF